MRVSLRCRNLAARKPGPTFDNPTNSQVNEPRSDDLWLCWRGATLATASGPFLLLACCLAFSCSTFGRRGFGLLLLLAGPALLLLRIRLCDAAFCETEVALYSRTGRLLDSRLLRLLLLRLLVLLGALVLALHGGDIVEVNLNRRVRNGVRR